jgi:small-conductance mechanosensitive channel
MAPPALLALMQEREPLIGPFAERVLLHNLTASAALLAAVLALRWVVRRWMRDTSWPSDEVRLRAHLRVGQISVLALVLGLFVIWAPELRTLALSAVAVAAALVLATKELLMCATGALLRATTGAYDVGDRIELDGTRGDVIRYGLLTTTVLEIGPTHQRTGRAVVLPNSLLLSKPVVNETFTATYVLHSFAVPVARSSDWQAAEQRLQGVAQRVCAEWVTPARRQFEELSREHGLTPPSVEPKVSLQLADEETLRLLVRVPTPHRQKGRVEQEILREFLAGVRAAG